MILIITSILYLVFSILFGKKLVLKKYNAKESKNNFINNLIYNLADELKINKINIYLYDGEPNAFVFGFPKSIAISNKMIDLLSKKELQSAIKHELSHIKNNDILVKPILQMMRIIFFYNPLVHIIYYSMIRERELMADSVFITSKVEKISLIEALIKINKYSNKKQLFTQRIIGTYSLPLLSYNSKKLAISERFDHLFGNHTKKTIYTIFISFIIIISNMSMIAFANSVIRDSNDNEIADGYVIENLNISRNLSYDHIKSIYKVFKDNNPQIYKKCVIYYVLVDIKSNLLSQRDLLNTIKFLLDR